MTLIRTLKAGMVFAVGLWSLLIALDNVLDYQSNWLFVQHVLSMDTVFPNNALRYRAITNPTVQTLGYVAIIAVEWLMSVLCLLGAWRLMRNRADRVAYAAAKPMAAAGLVAVFGLYYVGFVVVGGEWFSMWQSQAWNGQAKAVAFLTCSMLVLITLLIQEPLESDRASQMDGVGGAT